MFFSFLLPILLAFGGTYMLFKLRFFFFKHPVRTCEEIIDSLKSPRARKNTYLALAGTLGVGNIVGVAVGIYIGGAGCVFWIAVSSVFASVLKYSECSCATLFSNDIACGIPAVLEYSFHKIGKHLSVIYCAFGICLALIMGGALQSQSIASLLEMSFYIPKGCVAIIFAFVLLVVCCKNGEFVKTCTSLLVPFATLVYVVLSVLIIGYKFERLPDVFSDIFRGAFEMRGAVGGVGGFMLSGAFREGFSRGLLSNEAGAGTSSIAQSEVATSPHRAGLLGMLEVTVDTLLLCTLSGIAILSCGLPEGVTSGVDLLFMTVGDEFGVLSKLSLVFSVFVFALSTVLCWLYYGRTYTRILLGKNSFFDCFFIVAVSAGVFFDEHLIVGTSDLLLFLLTVLTMLAVIKSSDRIKALSEHKFNSF